MEKVKLEYGKWIPCKPGMMPEDLLPIQDAWGTEFTDGEVLIPHMWGNEKGGGNHYPTRRYRKKGNKAWAWWGCKTAKPLFWMAIPKITTAESMAVYNKSVYAQGEGEQQTAGE